MLDVRRDVLSMQLADDEKVELWLLDLVCSHSIYVKHAVMSDDDIGWQWNRRPPVRWSARVAIAGLASLLRRGHIQVLRHSRRGEDERDVPVDAAFVGELLRSPVPWRERHLPRREFDLSIRMTAEGAERWENFFQPDWSRYWNENPSGYGEDDVTTRNRYECGSNETRMSVLGRCVECLDIDLAFGLRDIELREVQPWQATYWKVLPRGYFVTVVYRDKAPEWNEPHRWCDACDRIYAWRRSIDRQRNSKL